ncbi:SCO family protein, partial [Flavobacteriaceae bacterium]|nr:SCO family protein [Flavobacteriaceae bacterium]
MKDFIRKYRRFILFFLLLSGIILGLFYNALQPQLRLPIYQPAMVNFELVDSTLQHVKKAHRIANFRLINQNGLQITEKDYQDHIYIADFFFTTCPTICPKMTENMARIQIHILEDPQVK